MNRWTALIATRNRRDDLARTLRALPEGLPSIVVDNASTDGTAAMVRREFPSAQVLRLSTNRGPTAKQRALPLVRTDLVLCLDDDCAPAPGALDALERRFDDDRSLGCLGLSVRLPDGRHECAALPDVFVGAAAALRTSALRSIGGWDERLFMQAEEYDLVFRLAAQGWTCAVAHDIAAEHRKSPCARAPRRRLYLDARNNIRIARAILPSPWRDRLARAYAQRYIALGRAAGSARAALAGVRAGLSARIDRAPMHPIVFDRLFGPTRIQRDLLGLRQAGARSVLLAPLGKNAPIYLHAAHEAGLRVVAVADDRFADADMRWIEGARVCTVDASMRLPFDAVVIADSAPVFAARALDEWRRRTDRPVLSPDALPGPGRTRAAA